MKSVEELLKTHSLTLGEISEKYPDTTALTGYYTDKPSLFFCILGTEQIRYNKDEKKDYRSKLRCLVVNLESNLIGEEVLTFRIDDKITPLKFREFYNKVLLNKPYLDDPHGLIKKYGL